MNSFLRTALFLPLRMMNALFVMRLNPPGKVAGYVVKRLIQTLLRFLTGITLILSFFPVMFVILGFLSAPVLCCRMVSKMLSSSQTFPSEICTP